MKNSRSFNKVASLFFAALIAVFVPALLGAQQVLKPYKRPAPQDVCGTLYLTEEKLAEIALNTTERHPEYAELQLYKPSWLGKGREAAAVGDSAQFWVLDLNNDEYEQMWAELKAVGEHVMIWVGKQDTVISDADVAQLLSDLETSTPENSVAPEKGIMQVLHSFFGNEPDFDGDGMTDILLYDIKDWYDPPDERSFIAGYFNSRDQHNLQSVSYSNERDILYLDTYPSAKHDLLSVTSSHELQHLIHFNHDQNEDTFINEGLSQLSQTITGFEWDDPGEFFDGPSRSLTAWEDGAAALPHYVKVQMFMLYLFEQFGGDYIKTLVNTEANGLSGVGSSLDVHGVSLNVSDVLRNWFIANYINDVSFDPRYGYSFPAATGYHSNFTQMVSSYPNTINGSQPSYSADYFKVRNGKGMQIDFSSTTIECLAVKETDGTLELFTINPDITFNDSTFGDTYKDLVLINMNWTGVNSSYSYTFESEQPYFIMEIAYDDGSPDKIVNDVSALQLGTNTPGYKWASKFSHPSDQSFLMGARMYTLFDTDAFGSGVFDFHVYDNTGENGGPGEDIIEPFKITFHDASTFYWMDVDLSDYEDELTAYNNDLYIAVEHPVNDTNTVAFGLDNSTPDEDNTWLFMAVGDETTPSWVPLANLALNVDGTRYELDDFDVMFRAEMSYLETAHPTFQVGYLQHPVFTENFELYLLGEKKIDRDKLSASITQGASTKPLVLSKAGNSGRVYVDNKLTLTENGQVDIAITGGYMYSFSEVDTTISFNVQTAPAGASAKISSLSGRASLIVAGGVLTKRTTLSAIDGYEFNFLPLEEQMKKSSSEAVGDPVAFGPGSLSGNFDIRFTLSSDELDGRDPANLRVCRLESGEWIPLETYAGDHPFEIMAKTSKLGTFQLRWSSEYSAVQPLEYALDQNYPNPFNAGTKIGFTLKHSGKVSLKIYDLTGREVRTLVSDEHGSGKYLVEWDGRNNAGFPVSSGMYIYRIKSGVYNSTRKLILLK